MKLHTVFITYNRLELTKQAIESYLETRPAGLPDFTYMVVDNGSTDGTAEWLIDLGAPVEWLGENRYPGYATNLGWGAEFVEADFLHRADNDFAFCLSPETRVLRDDYAWVAIGDVEEGQTLVGFDEQLQKGRGNQRRLRTSLVQMRSERRAPCCLVHSDAAGPITASADHLWLVLDSEQTHWKQVKTPRWKETKSLVPGDRILRFGNVWGAPASREDAHYLAGLFDGEGCLSPGNGTGTRLGFTQNPGPVLERGQKVLAGLGFHTGPPSSSTSRAITLNVKGGIPEFMRFLHQIPTTRFRDPPFWIGKRITSQNGYRHLHYSTVLAVEDIGSRDVVSLGTSTRTLIAEGLYTHNCPGWCEEVERIFQSKKVGQVGLRTDQEEMFAAWNVGGNCVIRRELWDMGLRYDERPWTEYPPGYSEDSFFSPEVERLGYTWTRVKRPCIRSLASGDLSDPYYQKSYGDRRIIDPDSIKQQLGTK